MNTNGTTRAHIMTSNFIPPNSTLNFNTIKDVLENSVLTEKFRLSNWKNAYISNRKLGDEFRYVFDRKFSKRFTGNYLDRPQILLKRLKIRDTTFEEEAVGLGEAYPSLNVQTSHGYERQFVEHSVTNSPGEVPGYASQGVNRPYRFRPLQSTYQSTAVGGYGLDSSTIPSSEYHKSYLNFLKYPGIVKTNLVPDSKGNISFKIPSNKYSNLFVLIADDENVTQVQIDLPSPNEETKRRNLALTDPLNSK